MFKLTILNKNESVYWTEHFNTIEEADKWLETERTRKYWDDSRYFEFEAFDPAYTAEIEIKNGRISVNEEKRQERLDREQKEREAREQKESLRSQRKQAEIAKLKGAKPTTLPEALKLLKTIAKIVLADKGEIDLAEDEASETADSKGRP